MPEIAISIKDVVKTFGTGEAEIQAIRGVTLDIFFGELFLIMGPSGSGKTTLLSIIGGVLSPNAGSVRVLDTELADLSDHRKSQMRAKKIGFMFQEYNLLPNLTAAENVAVPLLIIDEPWDKALEKAAKYLAAVGLGARASNPINQLSTGEKQRVAFARALVHEPQLLICDEPTAALDTETGVHVMELMRERALASDRTLIVVTHDNRIVRFADRIAYLLDGRMTGIKAGRPEEVSS
ncbi:MAG: ABC transporter ATP-binding protein [Nitrospirota bacterium]